MIHDYDRAHWFGASDGRFIFSDSHITNSWLDWWDVKCGKKDSDFKGNIYTNAGNTYEHSILRAVNPDITFDRQIIIPPLRLRVNLDGSTKDTIYEVKTYQIHKGFKVKDEYYYQAQLQMLAWRLEQVMWYDAPYLKELKKMNPPLKEHIILAYGLYPDEYYAQYPTDVIEDGKIPIDMNRIEIYFVKWSRGTDRKARKTLKKLADKLRKEEVYVAR